MKFADKSATVANMIVPNSGTLTVRGMGLQLPRRNPDQSNDPRRASVKAYLVLFANGNEASRSEISKCIRSTLESTLQFDLNLVKSEFKPFVGEGNQVCDPSGSFIEL